jgi:hypothetical protein
MALAGRAVGRRRGHDGREPACCLISSSDRFKKPAKFWIDMPRANGITQKKTGPPFPMACLLKIRASRFHLPPPIPKGLDIHRCGMHPKHHLRPSDYKASRLGASSSRNLARGACRKGGDARKAPECPREFRLTLFNPRPRLRLLPGSPGQARGTAVKSQNS